MIFNDFIEKYNIISVDIVINNHTLSRVKERVGDLQLDDIKNVEFAFQKYKGDVSIELIRVKITLENCILIGNLYKVYDKYYIKILTSLTKYQFALSKNMLFGSVLKMNDEFKITVKSLINHNTYFEDNDDLLKGITNYEVIENFEECDEETYNSINKKCKLNIGKYIKLKFENKLIGVH